MIEEFNGLLFLMFEEFDGLFLIRAFLVERGCMYWQEVLKVMGITCRNLSVCEFFFLLQGLRPVIPNYLFIPLHQFCQEM